MHKGSSLTAEDLAKNLANTRDEITQACRRVARDPREITLVAVSKGHDFSSIKALYEQGQRDFGESYAQEFIEKHELAKSLGLKIVWHFIGALQSNKLKLIKEAQFIHSVGSLRHAELLEKEAMHDIDIFLQVNLAGAGTRQGVFFEDVIATILALKSFSRLRLRGLMAILPQDPKFAQRFWFEKMSALRTSILAQGLLTEVLLSMGMSDDFEEAIAHGAHFVRIGTKIFGARN